MDKQLSFRLGPMEKQQSFRTRTMEKQQSFPTMDKQKSFRIGAMEKQKSFRMEGMDKQHSFHEKRNKDTSRKRGDSPLHLASRTGNLLQVKEILSDGDSSYLKGLISMQNNDGETALYLAAENGHAEVVREILRHSDTQSASLKAKNGFDSFHIAAKQGHVGKL
uniref:Ankyrin repeat-containing protein At5g02620 n=1 Tax=Anthurium amnicola TaxID=1678845 RepID=A0A1D1YBC4_9ARAE